MSVSQLPFRIRVGVTGHRSLSGAQRIFDRVGRFFSEGPWHLFDQEIKPKDRRVDFRFTLLSCLAEGADRLVAQAALQVKGTSIEAVLPLPADEYEKDFASPESRREFACLLEQAERVTVVKAESAVGEARNLAYERAGRYLVDTCDLLIAVWDGQPARGRGGTAEIVAYAREKQVPLVIISASEPHEVSLEKGLGLSSRAYDRLGRFNSFAVDSETERVYIANLTADLFDNPEGKKLSAEVKANIRNNLLPWYVRASLMAKKNQKKYLRAGLLVYTLSPLAVAAVAAAILIPALAAAAFLTEFFLLTIILFVLLSADRKKTHKNWIEARFLAEHIRSAFFLAACGNLPTSGFQRRAPRTRSQAGEWAHRAFAEIVKCMGPVEPVSVESCEMAVNFARRHWLREQIAFHAAKAKRSQRAGHRLEKAGWLVFLAAILAAAWHLLDIFLGHPAAMAPAEKTLLFLALLLPAIGASLGGVRGHREYSRLARRSSYMQVALEELDARLALARRPAELAALLGECEQLMLQDTREWLSLMTFAKVEAI